MKQWRAIWPEEAIEWLNLEKVYVHGEDGGLVIRREVDGAEMRIRAFACDDGLHFDLADGPVEWPVQRDPDDWDGIERRDKGSSRDAFSIPEVERRGPRARERLRELPPGGHALDIRPDGKIYDSWLADWERQQ